MSTYTMISVDSIIAHENNPRKEIVMDSEFNELVASIKARGVLQHLTVVPGEDKYKVVIGHRRLAAAKKAGLKEVPCVIENMTEAEQLHTMMMENMQRRDLTAREEALGFQMMLDLGQSVAEVSAKTGFSKTTISHRTKMLKLDSDKLKESEMRGAKMEDYIKLEQVKDLEIRNKLLDSVGTNNFNAELNKAIENQRKEEAFAKLIAEISKFATRIEKSGIVNGEEVKMHTLEWYYPSQNKEVVVHENGTFYFVADHFCVTVYEEGEAVIPPEAEEKAAKRKLYEERRAICEKANDDCEKLRDEFIAQFSAPKKYADDIRKFYFDQTIKSMMSSYSSYYTLNKNICEVFGMKNDSEEKMSDLLAEPYADSPETAMLKVAYAVARSQNTATWKETWDKDLGEYVFSAAQNNNLNDLYAFLLNIGYVMSDMEIKYCNGEIAGLDHNDLPGAEENESVQ